MAKVAARRTAARGRVRVESPGDFRPQSVVSSGPPTPFVRIRSKLGHPEGQGAHGVWRPSDALADVT
jgi:hypothetical protein